MRAYQTIRGTKHHHEIYFGHPKGDFSQFDGRHDVRLRKRARRVLKRGDRQRATAEELQIEHAAEVALQIECDAMLRQFEEDCRPPTLAEIEADRAWYENDLRMSQMLDDNDWYNDRYDDPDSYHDYSWRP